MTASLSLIVGLLTTAMSLLTLVQQNPELPQAQRDYARQTAEAAITQATNLMANQNVSTIGKTASTTPEVVEEVEKVEVEISLGAITKATTTAQISWTTNVQTSSKVTVTKVPVKSNLSTAQYLPSANGISKKGLVSIVGLEQNTEYHYLIESTVDGETVEKEGTFVTQKSEEQIAKEVEAARVQKMMDAIERDGYYISCSEDGKFCTKTTDGFCWSESMRGRGGPFTGRSCGG